ncbi:MAG TPA: creatininase family protein [Candidatus Nitrosocosmicus sp.]|nr:creatininase family protein [Candidatus Nitrosocosmicus sp.]
MTTRPRSRPRLVRLAECTWVEARALARDRRAVILLPLGALEEHGPHLPLLVDWLGAEELARRLAPHLARAGWRPVLAPSLPYGASPLAARWPGTVSLSEATLSRLIVEIVRGLASHGFRRFVLTNYQADPAHLRAIAKARRALARRRLRILVAGFSPDPDEQAVMLTPRVLGLMRSPRPEREWHSGEMETAMVLDARPSLVRRTIARRLPPRWVDFRAALARGARRFEQMDPGGRGYFGWPAAARAGTARRVMALRARLMAERITEALEHGRR